MSEPVIDLLEAALGSMAALGAQLQDEQWEQPTDCPGWSVKDQVSHIIGIERMLAELPTDPPATEGGLDGIAAFNEGQIAPRRALPAAEVLAELEAITAQRMEMLRNLTPEGWDKVGFTPVGEAPYRTFMNIRVFDIWVHEQDMRRAAGVPGHLSGPVPQHCMDWHANNLGYIVGKKAGAPEGATVAFHIAGDGHGPRGVTVKDGRAGPTEVPELPTAGVLCDLETLNVLCCGRTTPDRALADHRVALTGDLALAERIVRSLHYVS